LREILACSSAEEYHVLHRRNGSSLYRARLVLLGAEDIALSKPLFSPRPAPWAAQCFTRAVDDGRSPSSLVRFKAIKLLFEPSFTLMHFLFVDEFQGIPL